MSVVTHSPQPDRTALVIGNSRLHWASFRGSQLLQTWHTPHRSVFPEAVPQTWPDWQAISPAFAQYSTAVPYPPLYLASVVPSQGELWHHYPQTIQIQLADVPLQNVYPTLGLDRAISLYGAGITYGWPALVIDAGTALTLTGADEIGTVVGGAILPGLGLQLRSLHAEAAKLPLVDLPQQLPKRWATDTATAIQSGIIYTVVIGLSATITEWLSDYPTSCVVFTGGDAMALLNYVKEWHSSLQEAIAGQGEAISGREHFTIDPNLAFLGISVLSQISRNRHD